MANKKINFIHDSTTSWSDTKRYDFYLPDHNIIIETHGEQHYDDKFISYGGRTLKEEQENDKYKEQIARDNGVKHYIVIGCRYSDNKWIKENILKSDLSKSISIR